MVSVKKIKLKINSASGERNISILDVGDINSKNILLCLPGILELKTTFSELSALLENEFRIVSLDYCGRGDSDYLQNLNLYQISTYVEEVLAVYEYIIQTNKNTNGILRNYNFNVWRLNNKSIHLLGNSMGG